MDFSAKSAIVPFALAVLPLLSACMGEDNSPENICSSNPELCTGFNIEDGHCESPRTSIIQQRFENLTAPSDVGKLKELRFAEEYQKCLEYAPATGSTSTKDLKRSRAESMVTVRFDIEQIQKDLSSSNDPHVLFYLMSTGDTAARERFAALEDSPQMKTPELQLALATFYNSEDKTKTLSYLHGALEFYDGSEGTTLEQTVPEAIRAMATTYHQLGNEKDAYLWTRIAGEFELGVAKGAQLNNLYPMNSADRDYLDDLAEDISDQIQSGEYKQVKVSSKN
ncbi:DUF2989 domain-containing protein [Parasalinivibrio latis]|uniref:DUF2989 domain-containing protein n=1 Tax=Parasalinivibrio latis TaxID=2952610 RepID=UPI0030E5191A